jgi:LEA14-like dessication related protein
MIRAALTGSFPSAGKSILLFGPRARPVVVLLGMLFLLSGCASLQRHVDTPEVVLESFSLESLSLSRQRFRVTLEVSNPNDFRLPIASISYALNVRDVPLTRGIFDEGISLAAGATQSLSLSVETDLLNTGRGLLDWLRDPGEDIDYSIQGEVLPDFPRARWMPYSHSGRVELK